MDLMNHNTGYGSAFPDIGQQNQGFGYHPYNAFQLQAVAFHGAYHNGFYPAPFGQAPGNMMAYPPVPIPPQPQWDTQVTRNKRRKRKDPDQKKNAAPDRPKRKYTRRKKAPCPEIPSATAPSQQTEYPVKFRTQPSFTESFNSNGNGSFDQVTQMQSSVPQYLSREVENSMASLDDAALSIISQASGPHSNMTDDSMVSSCTQNASYFDSLSSDSYMCAACPKRFTHFRAYEIHFRRHTFSPLCCLFCKTEFLNLLLLRCHPCWKERMKNPCDLSMKSPEIRPMKFTCMACRDMPKFSTLADLSRHTRTSHARDVMEEDCKDCLDCPEDSIEVISESMENTDKCCNYNKDSYECKDCGETYDTVFELSEHRESSHKMSMITPPSTPDTSKPFLCSCCGKSFAKKNALQRHISTHVDYKPQRCPHCDFSCREQSNLQRHMQYHFSERRFVCELCGAAFHAKKTLETHHTYKHTHARNFVCHQCGMAFKTRNSLQRHVRTHEPVKEHRCMHCPMAFHRFYNLRRHVTMVHHDATAFPPVRRLAKLDQPPKPEENKQGTSPQEAASHQMKKEPSETSLTSFLDVDDASRDVPSSSPTPDALHIDENPVDLSMNNTECLDLSGCTTEPGGIRHGQNEKAIGDVNDANNDTKLPTYEDHNNRLSGSLPYGSCNNKSSTESMTYETHNTGSTTNGEHAISEAAATSHNDTSSSSQYEAHNSSASSAATSTPSGAASNPSGLPAPGVSVPEPEPEPEPQRAGGPVPYQQLHIATTATATVSYDVTALFFPEYTAQVM